MSYKNHKVVPSGGSSSPLELDFQHKLSLGFGEHDEDDHSSNGLAPADKATEVPRANDLDSQLPQLLDELRELLKDYPQCKRRDDEFLTKFLRVKDYDVLRALDSVRGYYLNIARSHHIIDGIRPEFFRALFDARIIYVLRSRCPNGTRPAVFRLEAWDPSKFSLLHVLQTSILVYQQAIEDKRTQLLGSTIIFDMKGLSLAHARQLTPYYLRRLVFSAQEGLPIRIKGIHFINHPYLFWGMYYIAQGFMKAKLRKRIHFHSDVDTLRRKFGKEILPKELGGILDLDEVADKEVIEKLLLHNRDYSHYY